MTGRIDDVTPLETITFRHSIALSMTDGGEEVNQANQAVKVAKGLDENLVPLKGIRKPDKFYYAKKVYANDTTYEGGWKNYSWEGRGQITFPNGVRLKGNFHDSSLQGGGNLKYPSGKRLPTYWHQDDLLQWFYKFNDGVQFCDPWPYCIFPDRRYAETHRHGFGAPGEERITSDAQTRTIPPGCFDAGEGFYDPQLRCIVDVNDMTKIIRVPTPEEEQNIIKKCRTSVVKPVGYRPDLYEFWSNGTKRSTDKILTTLQGPYYDEDVMFAK